MKKIVENGEYFRQARVWYHELYLMPFCLKYMYLFFFITTSSCLLACILVSRSILPINKELMYTIHVSGDSNYSANISSSFRQGTDADNYRLFADTFIRLFIESYEGYDYAKLQNKARFIKNNSSKIIFNKYYDSLSLENPNSPLIKYPNSTKSVTIESLVISSPKKAKARFTTDAIQENGTKLETLAYEADIEFEIDTIPPQREMIFIFLLQAINLKF